MDDRGGEVSICVYAEAEGGSVVGWGQTDQI